MESSRNSTVRDFGTEGPWIQVEIGEARLSILIGDTGQIGPWDIEYETSEGERYFATVATIHDIQRIMEVWKSTGECLSGRYFWLADLIIVAELNVVAVTDVVEDLVLTGELESAMSRAREGD